LPKRWSTAWFRPLRISLAVLVALLPAAAGQTALEARILQETNAVRARYGLPRLQWDGSAAAAAREHARDMLARGYFAHETPEGLTPAERMWRAGVREVTVGENIAFYEGYLPEKAVEKVVNDWMNSPHHRENILNPQFTHLGVGVAVDGERVMLVQDFLARPFAVSVWETPSRALVGVLDYAGSSRATVGLFVNGVFYKALQPPSWSGELELEPGSKVSLGLWRDDAYYLACSFVPPRLDCQNPKINWRASYRQELKNTVRLQIGLPAGEYTLARGAREPVPFRRVSGPVVYLEVPSEWGAVWIGTKHGDRVEYTHRIALR